MTAMISGSSPAAREKVTPPLRPAGEGVLCGREAERKIVRDLLRRAQGGLGGVVLVDGEPGIGKSLLLRDSTGEAAGRGFSLAEGAADQLRQGIPRFALRVALREPLAVDDPDRDLPDEPGWWISQVRARLEQRAAAAPVLMCLDDPRLTPQGAFSLTAHHCRRSTRLALSPGCWLQLESRYHGEPCVAVGSGVPTRP